MIQRRYRLRRDDFRHMFGERWKDYAREIVLIDGQRAADWIFGVAEDTHLGERMATLPMITPPWPLSWIQYRMPKLATNETGLKHDSLGVLTLSFEWDEESGYDRLRHMARILNRASSGKFTGHRLKIDAEEKAFVFGSVFYSIGGMGYPPSPIAGILCATNSIGEGRALYGTHENDRRLTLEGGTLPAFVAFAFAHCRNVDVQPDAKASARRPRLGHGKVIYREIDVLQSSRSGGDNSVTVDSEVNTAFHICRGHFKDFREKGLFGKNHGIYWWDMHARGSKKAGEIRKTYAA